MSTDGHALLRLLTWLSPAFPIGAFAYSHGLEWAVRSGDVTSANDVFDWIDDLISQGSGWNDAVLLAEAWHAALSHDTERLAGVAELAEAMAPSAERHMETVLQGNAFMTSALPWLDGETSRGVAYPIGIGITTARNRIALNDALTAFLHAFALNLVSAAIRLVPLGQSEGLAIIAKLEPVILNTVKRAAMATLDDLGSSCFTADMATLCHETLEPRLFRS